ncbi:hypothetical protein GW17_00060452, partial [Ensete ventricosum]
CFSNPWIGVQTGWISAIYVECRGCRGKVPATRSAAPAREVGETPSTEAPRSSSKRPFDAPVPPDDPAQRHKKVKILSRRHKSCRGEGGSRSHSRGKEPTTSVEELGGISRRSCDVGLPPSEIYEGPMQNEGPKG